MAADGCTGDEILAALNLTREVLQEPTTRERFDSVVELGHLRLRARLRGEMLRISRRGTRGKSVVAALALARNMLRWDRPEDRSKAGQAPPDNESAVRDLDRVLNKIFRNGPRCPTCGARQQRE